MTRAPKSTKRRVSISLAGRPHMRHDSLFRAVLHNPERLAIFLRENLPPRYARKMADALPIIESSDHIGRKLIRRHSDLLVRVKMDSETTPEILVLIEHKSYVDHRTAHQMYCYRADIWDAYRKASEKPPLILSIVLYTGERPWTAAASVEQWVNRGTDEALRYRAKDTEDTLVSLRDIATRALSRDPLLRAGLAIMKRVPAEELLPELPALAADSALRTKADEYMLWEYGPEYQDRLVPALQATRDEEESDMESAGDVLLRQGIEQGIEQGIPMGGASLFVRMLERRFGALPPSLQSRISNASLEQIEEWSDHVFDVQSLTELFGVPKTS